MNYTLKFLLLIIMLLPLQVQAQSNWRNYKFEQELQRKKMEAYLKAIEEADKKYKVNSQTQSNSSEVEDLKRQVEELKRQVNGQQNSGGNVSTQSEGELQPHQEFRPCFSCGGTRKCHQCTGQGTVVTWAGRNRIEQTCPGCARSGVCPACHGTGGTYETVYY